MSYIETFQPSGLDRRSRFREAATTREEKPQNSSFPTNPRSRPYPIAGTIVAGIAHAYAGSFTAQPIAISGFSGGSFPTAVRVGLFDERDTSSIDSTTIFDARGNAYGSRQYFDDHGIDIIFGFGHDSSYDEKAMERGVIVSDATSGIKSTAPQVLARLQELSDLAIEDGFELSQPSVYDFNNFLKNFNATIRPAISALDSGAIRAVWKNDEREQVALHYRGAKQVNYVLFHLENGEMRREYGQSSIAAIANMLTERSLWRLLHHEG